jgi:hypothetical protein|tara:strand:+ start:943 stop:1227 length:285 start_codon:yes stop_codon:yes gene_type:complete
MPADRFHFLYILAELSLEVWFQIEVISNVAEFESGLGRVVTNLGRGLALSMLLSHYLYLIASGLGLLTGFFCNQDRNHDHEMLHAMSKWLHSAV